MDVVERPFAHHARDVGLALRRYFHAPDLTVVPFDPHLAEIEAGQREMPAVLSFALPIFKNQQYLRIGSLPDQGENRSVDDAALGASLWPDCLRELSGAALLGPAGSLTIR